MEDFVKQMFAADLDAPPGDEAPETAAPEAASAAAAPAAEQQPPQAAAAAAAEPDSAVPTAAAAAEPVLDAAAAKRREKKLKRLLGEGGGGRGAKLYEAWLEANAEGVAAFRSAAGAALAQLAGRNYPTRQAAVVELLLVWLFRSKRTHLLEPSEQDPSKLLAQIALEDAIALLTQSLGVRGGHVPGVLERCPALLGRRPPPESLEASQELFGGRQALGAAVLRSPRILLMGVDMLKRRLEVLALLTHRSTREAAALVVEYPSLLGCGEGVLADNARFLGALLPLRPYNTLLQRFPYLLSTPLERRLRGLQRYLAREAPELAAVNLQLLVSQQPTLLLKGPGEVAAQWHLLRQAAASVPGWQSELEALSAPTLPAQPQAGGGSTTAAAAADSASGSEAQQLSEADQWLADMLSSLPGNGSGIGGEAASSQQASGEGEPEAEQPSWFHRDAAGEAAAVARGAFGTQQRPWAEDDRLRARQLARLLDARRWQVLRLLFLGETVGAEAGQRSLLDVVMAHRSAFEQAHPHFPDWLDEQLRREEEERLQAEEERERRRAERAAERAAAREHAAAAAGDAAAGEAAGGEAFEWSWDAAAAAGEPSAGAAAGSEAAPDAAAAAAAQAQAGTAEAPPAIGAAPQH